MPEIIPHHLRRPADTSEGEVAQNQAIIPLPLPVLQIQSKDRSLVCRDVQLATLMARGAIVVLVVLILAVAAVLIIRALVHGDAGLWSDLVQGWEAYFPTGGAFNRWPYG